MPPSNEERIATLEAYKKTQGDKLDELRADVKAIPAQLQQLSDELKSTFRRETRRCRRIQSQRCPGARPKKEKSADGAPAWPEILKQAAIGLSILGALLGSVYLGARENIRSMISTPTQQTQGQGGSK